VFLLILVLLVFTLGLVDSIQKQTVNQLLLFKRKDSFQLVFIHDGKAMHFYSKLNSIDLGKIQTEIFSEEQTAADYLKILGY
jgi:hypothetical protein